MMTTQRAIEPHEFYAYAEASEICRHCDRGRYAAIHESVTLTTASDNRAEGEEHSPLPWHWMPDEGQFIVSAKGDIVAEIPCQGCNPLDGQLIVRACNEHYERGKRIAQLEQIIRDQMSVLRDWRGADNVPQQVRDAMAIRLTELRRVVEGK